MKLLPSGFDLPLVHRLPRPPSSLPAMSAAASLFSLNSNSSPPSPRASALPRYSSSFLSFCSSPSLRPALHFSSSLPAHRRVSSPRSAPHFFVAAAAGGEKKSVLIVNTNSGGHAVIGFYFAKDLLGGGHDVTVLTVGEESSDKMKNPPFTRFSELVSAGGRTVWGDATDVGKVVGSAAFDVVLDNNGKDLDTVKHAPISIS